MNLLHQIVVAVLAVICFMGMAVQGAPCGYCRRGGGHKPVAYHTSGGGHKPVAYHTSGVRSGGGNNLKQTGGLVGGANILAAQG